MYKSLGALPGKKMIAPDVLPLTARGAVYHLDLTPEEVADVIITVGDPARVSRVSSRFDVIEVKRSHREFITHTGYFAGRRLSVLSTGIGMPNIDIVMNELDALVNIDLNTRTIRTHKKSLTIIRLGTTGGLLSNCMPGDIHISQYAIGFDTLLDYYQCTFSEKLTQLQRALIEYLAGNSPSFYLAEADEGLVRHFQGLGSVGITATCGGFYGPQGRLLRIPLRYPDLLYKLMQFDYADMPVINLEMETAAILGLGRALGHRCISLGVVLANRVKGLFVDDAQATVEAMIDEALQKVCTLP